MSQNIKLNGITIKQPNVDDFSIEKYNLTKAGRTSNGDMQMDLIAKKRKFTFKYEVLSGTELNTILNILDGNNVFITLSYVENNVSKSATVYAGAIKATQFRTDGVWYWKDVAFDLIER